jgi:hypothetical protein
MIQRTLETWLAPGCAGMMGNGTAFPQFIPEFVKMTGTTAICKPWLLKIMAGREAARP